MLAQFGSGSRATGILSTLKEKIQNNFLDKIIFFKTSIFFQYYKNKLSQKEIVYQLNNIRNLTSFASILSYICMCGLRIRIQEAPEYGFNTDPDPQHWLSVCLQVCPSILNQPTWERL